MMRFVILSWDIDHSFAGIVADRIREDTQAQLGRWQFLLDRPGALVATPSKCRHLSGYIDGHPTFIIGDVFPRGGAALERLFAHERFDDLCRDLADHWWGAYVAVQVREPTLSIFRDPIGMGDAITWSWSGLRIIATDPLPWLASSPPPDIAIDWARLGTLLNDSTTLTEQAPLIGIDTIPAGELVVVNGRRSSSHRLWEPAAFYHRERNHQADAGELGAILTSCIAAWQATYSNTMLEISGGFDSAVVAAGMKNGAATCRGVNFFTNDVAGDERRYARDIAAASRIPLDEVLMPVGSLDDSDLDGMPIGIRPGLGSTTLFHDRMLARKAIDYGADALLTGHGGDAVFFQHPTAAIASDPSFPRTKLGTYLALARWSKTSIWTVAGHALGFLIERSRTTPDVSMATLPLGEAGVGSTSAWAGNLVDLPPAKRMQILGIAGDRNAFGPSWRSEAMAVIHPLLSQPLVEWAIATDAYVLTQGRRDRALAREAFAHILPPSIANRKGKGGLNQFFGRSLAASTPFLRTFLLDGLLVEHGVMIRAKLEPMLDQDFLMQFDCYGKILSAIITEHWARVWQSRLEAFRPVHIERDAHASAL